MKLIKGQYTDCLLVNQPEEMWREATNMVFDIDTLKNEDGFVKDLTYGVTGATNFTTIGELYLPNDKTLFFETSVAGDRIMIKDNKDFDSSIVLVANLNFGFNVKYPIVAKAKYTNDFNIEVVFTDDYNPPRRITINSVTSRIIESFLEETKLFPEIEVPNFILKSVDSGGSLDRGSYHATIAYNFGDDDYTNWVGLSNQITLVSGGQSFTIEITELDLKFDTFKIGFIRVVDDVVVTAYESNIDYNVSGTSKVITVTGKGADINLADITIKNISYDRVGDLDTLDSRLYLAKLYRNSILEYQQYANNIRIEPIYGDFLTLDTPEDSYANPLIIFDKVGFQDDEVYAFYIRLHLKDGTIGGDFFIPSQGYNIMGIHTNASEEYPINKDYPLGNVRHHVFPRKDAEMLITSTMSGPLSDSIRTSGPNQQQLLTLDVLYGIEWPFGGLENTGTLGTVSDDTIYPALALNTVTFSDTLDIVVTLDYIMTATSNEVNGDVTEVTLEVFLKSTDGSEFSIWYVEDVARDGNDGSISGEDVKINISVSPGESIIIRGLYRIIEGTSGGTVVSVGVVNWRMNISGILPSVDANYFTKPTGIKVSNIEMPQEIIDKVQGYEILYAVRNNSNSRVLGQGIVYPNDFELSSISDKMKSRFHAFDIMNKKPQIYPTGVRTQYRIKETNTVYAKFTYLDDLDIVNSTHESEISNSKYIPPNNLAANNEDGEEHYSFVLVDGLADTSKRLLSNLVSEKANYYIGFETQILKSTGKVFKTPTVGIYQIDSIFGGDTYTCLYEYRLTKKRTTVRNYIRNAVLPVQSMNNIYLREWGDEWWEQPSVSSPPSSLYASLGLDNESLDPLSYDEKTALRADYTKKYSNYYDYDEAYNFGNKFLQGKIQGDTVQNAPFRIIRSPEQNLESKTSSWRTFLINDYYEQNRDKGIINNIAVLDTDKLLIHHTNGLFITNAKEKLASSVTEIVIGVGDIFDFAPKEIIFTDKGALGSRHKFANFVCESGYIFISEGRIYILSKDLKNISKGESKFFYNNLSTGDNPYLQDKTNVDYIGGISMAYDHQYERIIISSHSLSFDFTKSYSLRLDNWVGTHDWNLTKVFNSNKNLFSLWYNSNSNITELYKHNDPNSKCKYYNGIIYDNKIVIVANRNFGDKIFNNVNWKITGVENNKNFKTIRVKSDYDDTGEITILPFTGDIYTEFNTRRKHSTWYFNKLLVNQSELGSDNLITGLYAIIELKIDNTDQTEMSVIDIDYEYEIIEIQ